MNFKNTLLSLKIKLIWLGRKSNHYDKIKFIAQTPKTP